MPTYTCVNTNFIFLFRPGSKKKKNFKTVFNLKTNKHI